MSDDDNEPKPGTYRDPRTIVPHGQWDESAAERASRAKALKAGGLSWAEVAERLELPNADAARELAARAAD